MLEGELIKIQRLLNNLWKYAIKCQASDVYFLPDKKGYIIKIRVMDQLVNYQRIKFNRGLSCINYCKFYSGMSISEHRRPQLGSIKLNQFCSLRFSTVGDYLNRESMVVRLIKNLDNQDLNFLIPSQFRKLLSLAPRRGLMLFAGPTGSGKTTTIYQLAKEYGAQKMVMTIEDPVEIIQNGFLQLQINRKAGMNYQQLLKVGLRHRPDIFIIGEIRDIYTANAAVQAALSGHLVLSTVHAQSPRGVIDRMEQLQIDDHYLRQCLNTVVYQRLIPTQRSGMGALLNVVPKHRVLEMCNDHQFLKDWREKLDALVNEKRISSKVSLQYQFG